MELQPIWSFDNGHKARATEPGKLSTQIFIPWETESKKKYRDTWHSF